MSITEKSGIYCGESGGCGGTMYADNECGSLDPRQCLMSVQRDTGITRILSADVSAGGSANVNFSDQPDAAAGHRKRLTVPRPKPDFGSQLDIPA